MTSPTTIGESEDAYTKLSHLISNRLLGVKSEDQDLELEDADWRRIIDALSHKAMVLSEQTGKQIIVPASFVEFVKDAPVASGICCCGDSMDNHSSPMACGHSPVDQWDYSLSNWLKQIGLKS